MLLQDKVYRILHQLNLTGDANGTPLVVGVSGGADSLALLHVLHALAPRCSLHLHVATLDHGLRGAASAADAQFVEETARAWGIPVTVGHAHLDPAAPGVETRARTARYAFLASAAQNIGAKYVAVAHHADDQAETVLMHIVRGSGTRGLVGMTHQSAFPGVPHLTLIRPLLNVTRAEIEAYCAEHGLSPRQDSTNEDPTYLRNKIRLETLPYLRTLNPQITQALNRLSQIAAADDAYMEAELTRQTQPHVTHQDGRISLDLTVFRALSPALQRRWIGNAAKIVGVRHGLPTSTDEAKTEMNFYTDNQGYEHLVAAAEFAQHGQTGAFLPLPGNLRVRVDYTALVVERTDIPLPTEGWLLLPADAEIPVTIPGETLTPYGWRLKAVQNAPENDVHSVALHVPVGAEVILRTRRPGDRFAPPGLNGHTQKLKKYMIDEKLPSHLRTNVPLMIINGNIAAIILNQRWIISYYFSAREDLIFFIQIPQ